MLYELNSPELVTDFGRRLQLYIQKTLQLPVDLHEVPVPTGVPTFISHDFAFLEGTIGSWPCAVVANRFASRSVEETHKHISIVADRLAKPVIFAASSITSRLRADLIGRGVAFVVPDNQLFIPQMATDLRERFVRPKAPPRSEKGLSPTGQLTLFYHLLQRSPLDHPRAAAQRLGVTPMSVGRAYDELVAFGLAREERIGRQRQLTFVASGRSLLREAQPLLRSPVRSIRYIAAGATGPGLKVAGEAALATLGNLSSPRQQTFAVRASSWKALASAFKWEVVTSIYEARFAVETWAYDPAALSKTETVDPLSLYVQFAHDRDERLAIAAEELLGPRDMVTGIDKFREFFAGHDDKYVIIGGTACDLLFTEAGLEFRATKDIDLVLCVEVIDPAFGRQIAEFVAAGGYETKERGDGSRQFHRFIGPRDKAFPQMLEVFARNAEADLLYDGDIVRIPAEDEAVSLSAILMNNDYFDALKAHVKQIDGVTILEAAALIPFKARAHLDLAERREKGERVDSRVVNKHRADVFRLIQLLGIGERFHLPDAIQGDMRRFIEKVRDDGEFSTKDLKLRFTVVEGLDTLRAAYLPGE